MYNLSEIKERLIGFEFNKDEGIVFGISHLIVDEDSNHALVFNHQNTKRIEGMYIKCGEIQIINVENEEEIFSFWVTCEYEYEDSETAEIKDVSEY